MRRKLFTLAAGVSAVLCAAVCVLWVRSYFYSDKWLIYGEGWAAHVHIEQPDTLVVAFERLPWSTILAAWPNQMHVGDASPLFREEASRPSFNNVRLSLAGFGVGWQYGYAAMRWVQIPLSLLTVITGILPVVYVQRARRRRRADTPRCRNCGYDLRATPDRCPECGSRAADDKVTT